MLITAPDGELLGIRVEWRIKPEYLGCQFTTLRVELNNGLFGKDINVNDSVASFPSDHLQCNTQYRPRIRAVISQTRKDYHGALLFYSGKTIKAKHHAYSYT